MHREDAEEAMEACNEADPFNVGRLLMMRWGKNVKKNVRQGTGGDASIQPSQWEQDALSAEASRLFDKDPDEISLRTDGFPAMIEVKGPQEAIDISKAVQYEAGKHAEHAIHVKAPTNADRFHFISTVASFVAKDGSQLEQKLIETEHGNPDYDFLIHEPSSTGKDRDEHIFYRWRVYAFCQGDTFSNWRTEPFVMFHPNGRFWIPPPLDREASNQEKEKSEERTENIRRQKDQRIEKAHDRKELLTGRQIERARSNRRKGNRRNLNWDGGTHLSIEDRDRFNWLVRKKLTISRESICTAMAFCFEKSGAAQEIAALLKDTLMDDAPHVTVDMRIARLYLLSDILFNSQQPGVKNAFIYRDALEKMAPEIFTSLGRHGSGHVGRMTMNKLKTAVSTVLGAWTEWSVYNPTFLDELEARFAGKEISTESKNIVDKDNMETLPLHTDQKTEIETEVVIKQARGDWTEVASDEDEDGQSSEAALDVEESAIRISSETIQDMQEPLPKKGIVSDGRSLLTVETSSAKVDDLDGSPIDDLENSTTGPQHTIGSLGNFSDVHIGVTTSKDDFDGEPIDDDIDGEPMDEEVNTCEAYGGLHDDRLGGDDIDGEALEEEEDDLDGMPLTENDQGIAANDEYLDGEALDDDDAKMEGFAPSKA